MNVLNIDLINKTSDTKTYRITYQEETERAIETTLAGENTFNYKYDPTEILPESVVDFAEKWILGDL